jgi:hypothetical protein
MSCTLTWTINVNEEALKGDIALNAIYSSSLFAEYSSSFFVPVNAYLVANYHNDSPQQFARNSKAALQAEYSGSEFAVCGNEITSANPTTITVDNTNISSDNIFLLIDTNNP